VKKKLESILKKTIESCFDAGKLKLTPLPDYTIEVPESANHGHFATNLPMVMASTQRRAPREIAGIILENMKDPEGMIEKKEIAGPGFINFTIARQEWLRSLYSIVQLRGD
jgi:arginyl-tRNA synthetase